VADQAADWGAQAGVDRCPGLPGADWGATDPWIE
jgi:hypothetical protein